MNVKKLVALLLALSLVFTLVACAQHGNENKSPSTPVESADPVENNGSDSDGVFKIGVYNYMAGSTPGAEQPYAFQVAMDRYNNEINGEKIEIITYDTQNNPAEAVIGAQYLISQGVDIVIGSYQSGDVMAAYPYFEEAGIVNLMNGTSGSIVNDEQHYTFRGSYNANLSAAQYVQLVQDFGYTNVALVYGQDENSVSNYEEIRPLFEAAGLNIVATETGNWNDTDFSAQCMKIVAANPEIVYCVMLQGGTTFVKQLREYGYNGIIMNKDEWKVTNIDTVGYEFSNYIISISPYTTYASIEDAKEAGVSENLLAFIEAYVEASGGQMPTSPVTYRLHDSMLIALEAATRAGENCHDSEALVNAILSIDNLQGCAGTIDFTQGDREPVHVFTPIIFCDGGNKTVETWKEQGGYEAYLEATGRAK